MRRIYLIGIIICFASCASVHVKYDYDTKADFSSYRTYNYFRNMDTGMSDLDTGRLVFAMDSLLQQKGIRQSEEPEFLINIQSQTFLKPSNSSVGVGVGGTGGNVGGGVSIGVPVGGDTMERELVFDFVDSQKNQLYWQALCRTSAIDNASPETRRKKIIDLVAKVLEKYPPELSGNE